MRSEMIGYQPLLVTTRDILALSRRRPYWIYTSNMYVPASPGGVSVFSRYSYRVGLYRSSPAKQPKYNHKHKTNIRG